MCSICSEIPGPVRDSKSGSTVDSSNESYKPEDDDYNVDMMENEDADTTGKDRDAANKARNRPNKLMGNSSDSNSVIRSSSKDAKVKSSSNGSHNQTKLLSSGATKWNIVLKLLVSAYICIQYMYVRN